MSYPIPSCPKCQQPMQTGFIIDRTYGANLLSTWSPGEARVATLFGLSTGTLALDAKQEHPVTCYRCAACSYLEFYAYPLPSEVAETTLLRPAQGTTAIEAQQLLRGSSAEEN